MWLFLLADRKYIRLNIETIATKMAASSIINKREISPINTIIVLLRTFHPFLTTTHTIMM